MKKIFLLIGKSATGKDSLLRTLLSALPELHRIVPYTTRPIRKNERNGYEYYFVSSQNCEQLDLSGKIIERRTYQTVFGPWDYFTADDGQINLDKFSSLMIGTLESYKKLQDYFGEDKICPLYIQVGDYIRLERAIKREKDEKNPNYRELCRRFLADEEDFNEENLREMKIVRRFINDDFNTCKNQICNYIRNVISMT